MRITISPKDLEPFSIVGTEGLSVDFAEAEKGAETFERLAVALRTFLERESSFGKASK